jgi:hypothetical protein
MLRFLELLTPHLALMTFQVQSLSEQQPTEQHHQQKELA